MQALLLYAQYTYYSVTGMLTTSDIAHAVSNTHNTCVDIAHAVGNTWNACVANTSKFVAHTFISASGPLQEQGFGRTGQSTSRLSISF